MQIFNIIWGWLSTHWLELAGIIVLVEKGLRLLDKLLPQSITVDNDIADILAKIIKAFPLPKKNK